MSSSDEKSDVSSSDVVVRRSDTLEHTLSSTDVDTRSTHSKHTLSKVALRLIVFSLCLAQFLSALDITIVSTALPTIASQLKINGASYAWVGSSYNLASTASTPLWAKCSDIWGRRPLLLLANAMFMAGSLISALAYSGGILIAGRTIQGFGGGGIGIMITIIIADLFPINERAKYYGLTAVVWAIASALGPILGGIFAQSVSWRWCFYINLPLDAISLILVWLLLRISTTGISVLQGLRSFDWIGSAAIVGGTICFLCGLEGGADASHGWKSAYSICLLITGVTFFVVFILHEAYLAVNPLVPMRIFIGRANAAALTAAVFHTFTFIAYDYFLPLYYQVVLDKTPIISGVLLFAFVIPLSCMASGTGFFIKKTGAYHRAAQFGSVIMALGTGLLIDLGIRYQLYKIIVYQIVIGLGAGPLFLSPLIAFQSHIRKSDIASGSSALTFLRSLGSSVSIVIGSVVLQQGLGGKSIATIPSSSGSHDGETARFLGARQQYVTALRHLWIFYTAICGIIIVSALLIAKDGAEESTPGYSGAEDAGNEKQEGNDVLQSRV